MEILIHGFFFRLTILFSLIPIGNHRNSSMVESKAMLIVPFFGHDQGMVFPS